MKLRWSKVLYWGLLKGIFYSFIFFFGLGMGLLFDNIPNLSWNNEMSIGDFSSIFLAIITPIWVPMYLDKKITNKRVGKDMIIESCLDHEKSGLNHLEEVVNKVMAQTKVLTKAQSSEIVQEVSRLSSRLSLIIEDINNSTDIEIREVIDALKRNQHDLWLCLTSNLKDKKPKITPVTYNKATKTLYIYLRNLYRLKTLINEF